MKQIFNLIIIFALISKIQNGYSQIYFTQFVEGNTGIGLANQNANAIIKSGQAFSLTAATGTSGYLWYGEGLPSDGITIPGPIILTNTGTINRTVIYTLSNSGNTGFATRTLTVTPEMGVPEPTSIATGLCSNPITLTASGCNGTIKWYKRTVVSGGYGKTLVANSEAVNPILVDYTTGSGVYFSTCTVGTSESFGSNIINISNTGLLPSIITSSSPNNTAAICPWSTVQLSDTGNEATDANTKWYRKIGTGSYIEVGTGLNITTQVADQETSFYATLTFGACPAVNSGVKTFSIKSPNLPPVLTDASVTYLVTPTGNTLSQDCGIICKFGGGTNVGGVNVLAGKNLSAKVTIDPAVLKHNNQPYLKRHFDLEPELPLPSGTIYYSITMYIPQADFDAFNAVSSVKLPLTSADAEGYLNNLVIWQTHGLPSSYPANPGNYSGSTNSFYQSAAVSKSWNSGLNCWQISVNTVNFSGFFITAQGATALPVKMISLNAKAENEAIKLDWETSYESNAQEFEIERSADAKTFVKIGEITANGNSDENIKYSYTDEYPYEGLNYYRLKQIDWGGKFEYSKIIATNFEINDKIKIYPNPVENVLKINAEANFEIDEINIFDELGRIILKQKNSLENINTTSLQKGKYYLHFRFLDGKSTTKSFLKN